MKRIFSTCLLLAGCIILFAGCVPGDGSFDTDAPAGFFWGVWHGAIALITLIWSFFDETVTIYEVYNTGFGYNAGFLFGAGSMIGGSIFKGSRRD